MEYLRFEFADPVEKKMKIVMLHQRDIDSRMPDDFDGGRDNRVNISCRRTNENNRDGLVRQTYEQVLEIGRIFGKRLPRRDKCYFGRPWHLRL
jgi:hypothetical protein